MWNFWWFQEFAAPEPSYAIHPLFITSFSVFRTEITMAQITPVSFMTEVDMVNVQTSSVAVGLSFSTEVETVRGM